MNLVLVNFRNGPVSPISGEAAEIGARVAAGAAIGTGGLISANLKSIKAWTYSPHQKD